jgi:coenzyme PQQ precursor peptide PqqA
MFLRAGERQTDPRGREQGDLHGGRAHYRFELLNKPRGRPMAWTTPTLIEICIGLEINGYLPAEF